MTYKNIYPLNMQFKWFLEDFTGKFVHCLPYIVAWLSEWRVLCDRDFLSPSCTSVTINSLLALVPLTFLVSSITIWIQVPWHGLNWVVLYLLQGSGKGTHEMFLDPKHVVFISCSSSSPTQTSPTSSTVPWNGHVHKCSQRWCQVAHDHWWLLSVLCSPPQTLLAPSG